MNKTKLKEIQENFIKNDEKLVQSFNQGLLEKGSSVEQQIIFLQTRLLLSSSILNQLLEILIEESENG